jgi:hypothetical protein
MARGRTPIVQCTASEWRDACRTVRACVPPPDGFAWRFVWCRNLNDDRGDCERRAGSAGRLGVITIRIERGMSRNETIDVLIHEVAHAFDKWDHHGWSGDHSDTFWIWCGRVYRRFWGIA